MSYSSNLSAVPAADDEDFVVDDSDYLADRADRSGLPVIPRAAPKHGDTIDVESIKREFATRAVRRSSPSANADSIELTSIPAALPRDNDDDNDEGEVRSQLRRTMRLQHPAVPASNGSANWMLMLHSGGVVCVLAAGRVRVLRS